MDSIRKVLANKDSTSLVDKEGYCVEFDTTGINVVNAINDTTIGIITKGGATESEVCIFGECMAIAGAAITAGQKFIPHTDGTVKNTTASALECGLALQTGVAGDWVKVHVQMHNKAT
jgi:hypothetical protein